jgi:hypothetical protein
VATYSTTPCTTTPGGLVEITTRTTRDRAVLSITNTGPRIRPEPVDDLFQPFRRLGDSRIRHANGYGLGRSIVAAVAIAVAHRADIVARPGVDGGLHVAVKPNRSDRRPMSEGPGITAPSGRLRMRSMEQLNQQDTPFFSTHYARSTEPACLCARRHQAAKVCRHRRQGRAVTPRRVASFGAVQR